MIGKGKRRRANAGVGRAADAQTVVRGSMDLIVRQRIFPCWLLGIAFSCGCNQDRRPVAILDGCIGKDLRHEGARDAKRLLEIVDRRAEQGPSRRSSPWYVWKTNAAGEKRYVVFERQSVYVIPGTSSATIHLLGPDGTKINTWAS